MKNRYKLDVLLTDEEEDKLWEMKKNNDPLYGRRISEYFHVVEHNRGMQFAIDRLNEAYAKNFVDEYGIDFLDGSEYAFVTENHDLASELIRILELDFIYDFKADVFIFDIWACHEAWLSYLYERFKGRQRGTLRAGDVAERYVREGYGIYQSSQSYRIMIGEDVSIPSFLSQFKNRFLRI
ncbi:hypothetical protein [Xanthomonas phage BUDD]|nr:hypothetical protein [Xanthomonas phage BUDD]